MPSVYILQFKNGGEMEDIQVFLDRETAMNILKTHWRQYFLLEYEIVNGVGDRITRMYACPEGANILEI